jgi:hypothetical protein
MNKILFREPNDKIKAYAEKLPWLSIDPYNIPVIILDHHALATFRVCPEKFKLEFVDGYHGTGRVWFLDFGILFHSMVEDYYNLKIKNSKIDIKEWAFSAVPKWDAMGMEFYATSFNGKPHKDYIKVGGVQGFVALLLQYGFHFSVENERLRVIATEIYFGKGREVPIEFNVSVKLYLSGKMDLLIDDGRSIGPMDHKTVGDFQGKSQVSKYDCHEGMTGYLYAAREIVKSYNLDFNRIVNKIWMNFIQVKPEEDATKRFSRMPIFKTDWQLEQFRLRQIRTMYDIYNMLYDEVPAYWNTSACKSYMHGDCSFYHIHRLGSEEEMNKLLNIDFARGIWNPENTTEGEKYV